MGNEKYVNYYIEILTATLNDAVGRNISLQANARISEEVIEEQQQRILQLEEASDSNSVTVNERVAGLEKTISELRDELANVNRLKNEYENVKHQVQHVDTFRNELLKEREEHQKTRDAHQVEIDTLNKKIDYLQLTPAKRKKVDEANAVTLKDVTTLVPQTNEIVRDGGSF